MQDYAEITVSSGSGGDGFVHGKRVKYNAFAGPDGGDGGNGGSVYIVGDSRMKTLLAYKRKSIFKAQNGQQGQINFRNGTKGDDLYLRVPLGTVVTLKNNEGSSKILFDITEPDIPHLLAKGGIGGYGNAHFKSSTDKTPDRYTPGTSGKTHTIVLEMKILSDVGLIGLPSAGKSTLLNTLTKSSYKTASYHFTTLSPNLGVLFLDKNRQLVIADLPGLIEGASSGKGLGDTFLRHIERCAYLIHVISLSDVPEYMTNSVNNSINSVVYLEQLYKNYQIIRSELQHWSASLLEKPEIVVFNKHDMLVSSDISEDDITSYFMTKGVTKSNMFFISNYTLFGVSDLLDHLSSVYSELMSHSKSLLSADIGLDKKLTIDIKNLPNKRVFFNE